MTENLATQDLYEWTVRIVAAQVSRNAMPATELPGLIRLVHDTLAGLGHSAPPEEELKPAVPIKRSVTPEYIICLEDGRKLKMLKRHLKTAYDMTPDEYRARWGLPPDYPMVAPKYASQRSSLAKRIGLGRRAK
ncbi:MAG: MucR family transcriptional regulator [Rhodospirillales bacterium]